MVKKYLTLLSLEVLYCENPSYWLLNSRSTLSEMNEEKTVRRVLLIGFGSFTVPHRADKLGPKKSRKFLFVFAFTANCTWDAFTSRLPAMS